MQIQGFLILLFALLVAAMLALDLGVFHRRAHRVSLKESLLWGGLWIALALLFALLICRLMGLRAALQYLTAYTIEKSLSVDNMFVFLLIFEYFAVPPKYQHRVLFWGILGAVLMRGAFIAMGITLLRSFHFMVYVFGAFLIYTGLRVARRKEAQVAPERNPILRAFRKVLPTSTRYHGQRFFFRQGGRLVASPLVVVLLVIESTDIVFALDSIPAVLAITTDPLIVYTSNIFAILGLRALYFALSELMHMFYYLNQGLAAILVFVGAKMVLSRFYHVPVGIALTVVLLILTATMVASYKWHPERFRRR